MLGLLKDQASALLGGRSCVCGPALRSGARFGGASHTSISLSLHRWQALCLLDLERAPSCTAQLWTPTE